MKGYPIVLTGLADGRCLVVGGGAVAARKAAALAEAGARPLVISPELGSEMEAMATAGLVEPLRRPYREGDLAGATLAIAATGDCEVNRAVSEEARRRAVPVNVVDDPELCTFIVPAVVRRGELTVAISTGGGSPALARRLREALEAVIDPGYGDLLAVFAELRPQIIASFAAAEQAALWRRLLDGEVLACLRTEGVGKARERAQQIVAQAASGNGTPRTAAPGGTATGTDPAGRG